MDDKELLRRAAQAAGGLDWQWWTSNSYRRLTFKDGANTRDGGALHGTVHPYDKWPNVAMAPGVQEFIELASPAKIVALTDRIAELESTIRDLTPTWRGPGCWCSRGWDIAGHGHEPQCVRAAAALGGKHAEH
jgi:hypothetical protein